MERLKNLKSQIMCAVEGQMGNLQKANYEELGAAIDMIKDLTEAEYYCTIVKAMEEKAENPQYDMARYYTETPHMYMTRDMDWNNGRSYYGEDVDTYNKNRYNSMMNGENSMRSGDMMERDYPNLQRDEREGRSPIRRKNYMESKRMHKDKASTMQELEDYAQGLTTDIIEMIKDASPEEKQMLQQKISMLANKIV